VVTRVVRVGEYEVVVGMLADLSSAFIDHVLFALIGSGNDT
jgi:cell division inhibitor SulA